MRKTGARSLEILIPTYNRASALAVTLTALSMQGDRHFCVLIADQSDEPVANDAGVATAIRLLEHRDVRVRIARNLPRQGLAQQRQFLLDACEGELALYLDDDLTLEPWVVGQLRLALEYEGCGFVGSAPIGLSYRDDVRPHQQSNLTLWQGRVEPERVEPDSEAWARHQLHNAANPLHLAQRLGVTPETTRLYKVAWVGGCVLYDTQKLRECGGFEFWDRLPSDHCGEDVQAQLCVMARYGGAAVLPSGVYHQELPTTVPNREHDAPRLLKVDA